jgi:hypothetical protein
LQQWTIGSNGSWRLDEPDESHYSINVENVGKLVLRAWCVRSGLGVIATAMRETGAARLTAVNGL